MSKLKSWIISFRLRTLPLALSSVFMGSIIAAADGMFKGMVLLMASLTTLFLQVLSNLSNDYGDAVSGADNDNRVGPKRMVQSGIIKPGEMKRAMIVTGLLSLISGVLLLYFAFEKFNFIQVMFFLLGIGAIIAAVRYTVGSNPYGYRGLGDIYVFIFFGLAGVAGTWFLHTNIWHWSILLPASTIGFFSTGVLNLNNIRDIESDRLSNKTTLVVKMGRRAASWYHLFIIGAGWVSIMVYFALFLTDWRFCFVLISLPLFIRNIMVVFKNKKSTELDSELRNLALSTLLFVALSAFIILW